MDKNFLMAFLLSTAAIFAYYTLFPPPEKPVEQEGAKTEIAQSVTEQTGKEAKSAALTVADQPPPVAEASGRKTIAVESDLYKIEIDSLDGSVKNFLLKGHKYSMPPHFSIVDWVMGLFRDKKKEREPYDPDRLVNMVGDLSDENRVWKLSMRSGSDSVNYHASRDNISVSAADEQLVLTAVDDAGLEIFKTITFKPNTYMVDMEVRVQNRTGKAQPLAPAVNFGAGNVAIAGESLPKPKTGMAYLDENFETYDAGDFEEGLKISNPLWVGVMDTYFVSAVRMGDSSQFQGRMSPLKSRLNGDETLVPKLEYVDAPLVLENNQVYRRSFRLYVGPKIQAAMEEFDYTFPLAMDLGWFDFLAHPLLSVLRWLQRHVVNWGVAIILLTVIVRSAMFPLAYKGMTSMRKMSALNPKIKEIRDKHKDNKERMNKEIMQFYSQHKINPMGGCLPMLLQIPVFIALYQALLPAIELRHTPFVLWMQDLSAYDYTLILPILMGATMFVQQTLSPTPAMDPTQQKIMRWMPAMMVLFFLNMPSGLVLYWVVSNIISIGQQLIFNKVAPVNVEELTAKGKGKSRGGPKADPKAKTRSKGKK